MKWSQLFAQKGIAPQTRSSHSMTVIGSTAYVLGGEYQPRLSWNQLLQAEPLPSFECLCPALPLQIPLLHQQQAVPSASVQPTALACHAGHPLIARSMLMTCAQALGSSLLQQGTSLLPWWLTLLWQWTER